MRDAAALGAREQDRDRTKESYADDDGRVASVTLKWKLEMRPLACEWKLVIR